MSQKTYRRYTPEFKEQAFGLLALGKPVSDVARELQISDNLLYNWRSQSQRTPCVRFDVRTPVSRRKMTFLKKAAIILGSRPQSSCAK